MNQLTEIAKGVIMFLFVFVVIPVGMSLRVEQLEKQNTTDTVNYYEK